MNKTATNKTQNSNNASNDKPQQKKSFRRLSEYGKQLEEKQKVKRMYGMREKQFRNFFKLAVRMEGAPGENLLNLLESRLDNAVYRLKMATNRTQARQIIVHGHIRVNGKKVTAPAAFVSIGDVISLSERALEKKGFLDSVVDKRMNIGIKVPSWLELMKSDRSGRVLRKPVRSDLQVPVEEHLIVELYSK